MKGNILYGRKGIWTNFFKVALSDVLDAHGEASWYALRWEVYDKVNASDIRHTKVLTSAQSVVY